ncbi:leucine--tRNA ligase [Myroides sp. LJL110]
MKYNPQEVEAKWQKFWSENQTFKTDNVSSKPKYYVLDMFPYPSGAGLHVGHPLGYIASDIFARYKRHKGFNVLHPQGYDSFGLPAEQYAIQTGQHPALTTEQNIERYREQLDRIGFSFDWSREVRTSNADYYKHTQWIFIQLFNSWFNLKTDKAEHIDTLIEIFEKQGNKDLQAACQENMEIFDAKQWAGFTEKQKQEVLLGYRMTYLAETEVNWCAELGTVLANDEIKDGLSERGGYPVVRKKMKQWSMRISAYADRLLQGLETIDWTESLKESQRNWIGKSVGALVSFKVKDSDKKIEVFTTRPETIFGVSFMTLAPEHELVSQITTPEQRQAVDNYIQATSKRSERERMADVKTISGVFTGAYAEHPFTKEPIEIWIGDYVLAGYGTGAVMAVPSGDSRDYLFAKHFNIPIKNVFDQDISEQAYSEKTGFKLINSDFLNGLSHEQGVQKAIEELEAIGQGSGKTNYRLRDAVFSRQRYWGEPFPVYYKDGLPQMIDAAYLPVVLPEVEKYLPTPDGQPPLGNAKDWAWDSIDNKVVSNTLIDNVNVFPLELNTMPGWAGSSWYWMRYMDPNNSQEFASKQALDYWQAVDLYIGGSEHATGHLLYSRFWNKFLKDLGYAPTEEPFSKLINQGMILGTSAFVYRIEGTNTFISKDMITDQKVQQLYAYVGFVNSSSELDIDAFKAWRPDFADAEFILNQHGKYIVGHEVEKMSKSYFNVVNPDDICQQYGADTLRLYEMFLGPLEQAKPWNTAGISGVAGFLKKLWKLYVDDNGLRVVDQGATADMYKSLHKTIKKVTEDIEGFSFNTSVSQFMICVNELSQQNCHHREILEPLTILISPYAPHIAEELWSLLGHKESISLAKFPEFEQKYLEESSKEYPVSFNGKMRFKIELGLDLTQDQIQEIILADERTQAQLQGKEPKKIIIIPGKIINIVG